jgi:uncharacterized protein (TIGR02597 family)
MTFTNTYVARSLAACLFLASLSALPAQSVVTDPVGFTTLTVAAKPAVGTGLTFISLNMFRPTAYRSLVVSAATVGGVTVLTFPAGSFTANQFTGATNPCFVEIAPTGAFANGSGSGLISDISANDTNTITLADNVTASITGGTTAIKVRPHWTFGSAFGVNNSAGFAASFSPTNADLIGLTDPTTGQFVSYFYSTTAAKWITQIGGTDSTNKVIPPDAGLLVQRKPTTPLSFTLVGEVKLGPTAADVLGGAGTHNTLVSNPFPLASQTLATSGLYQGGDVTKGIVGSFSPTNSDFVGLLTPGTSTTGLYFYSTTANGWRKVSDGSVADSVVIPEGSAVLITRKLGRQSFTWYIPQPTMNLN